MSNNNAISVNIISNLDELIKIEDSWNKFVKDHTQNPFLLSGFFKEFMRYSQNDSGTPAVLIFSVSGRIVGIAPLMTKRRLGVRFGRFLLSPSHLGDFVFDDRYQELCIDKAIDYVFKILHCQLLFLTMSLDSPHFKKLMQLRHKMKVTLLATPARGHYALSVNCSWAEFEKLRGKKLRQDLRRTERYLDLAGSWKIGCLKQGEDESSTIEKILRVESVSWKDGWRNERGIVSDQVLMALWEGSVQTAGIEQEFKWTVWFLELNGLPIAYALVPQYRDVAYLSKTSHDKRYRRFSPGIYVVNAAIRDLFDDDRIEKIDFHTDLPFVRTWTSICLPRVSVLVSRRKVLPTLIRFMISSEPLKHILKLLLNTLPFAARLI